GSGEQYSRRHPAGVGLHGQHEHDENSEPAPGAGAEASTTAGEDEAGDDQDRGNQARGQEPAGGYLHGAKRLRAANPGNAAGGPGQGPSTSAVSCEVTPGFNSGVTTNRFYRPASGRPNHRSVVWQVARGASVGADRPQTVGAARAGYKQEAGSFPVR